MAAGREVGERPGMRIHALDGLRGVAAFSVLLHHTLLVNPSLVDAYGPDPQGVTGALARALTYTPLHLLWAGPEAVIVFFVLSGYVLCLPYSERDPADWTPYFARRAVRIYLPVWAALASAIVLTLVVGHTADPGASWWLLAHPGSIDAEGLLKDAILLFGAGSVTTVLWSLQFEMVFSLLLPCYVAISRLLARRPVVAVLAIVAPMAISPKVAPALLYLPMFGVGTVLACTRDRWHPWASAALHGRRRSAAWAVAVVLLSAKWLALALPTSIVGARATSAWFTMLADVAITGGAALVLVLVLVLPRAAHRLEARPVQWLGRHSYSLYLVHEPVVVAIAFAAGGWHAWLLPVVVIAALALAAAFHAIVEVPSIRLSRRVGGAVAALR